MFKSHWPNKKFFYAPLVLIMVGLLSIGSPLLAKRLLSPASSKVSEPDGSNNQKGVNEPNGNNNDFNNDVKKGEEELKGDPKAQKLQEEIIENEEQQVDVDEISAGSQEQENQKGVEEPNGDNNQEEINENDSNGTQSEKIEDFHGGEQEGTKLDQGNFQQEQQEAPIETPNPNQESQQNSQPEPQPELQQGLQQESQQNVQQDSQQEQ